MKLCYFPTVCCDNGMQRLTSDWGKKLYKNFLLAIYFSHNDFFAVLIKLYLFLLQLLMIFNIF